MSFFLMCVFQWFLILLSVLPGNLAAILDHLHRFKPIRSQLGVKKRLLIFFEKDQLISPFHSFCGLLNSKQRINLQFSIVFTDVCHMAEEEFALHVKELENDLASAISIVLQFWSALQLTFRYLVYLGVSLTIDSKCNN